MLKIKMIRLFKTETKSVKRSRVFMGCEPLTRERDKKEIESNRYRRRFSLKKVRAEKKKEMRNRIESHGKFERHHNVKYFEKRVREKNISPADGERFGWELGKNLERK